MFNLLQKQDKEVLKKQYQVRRIIVFLGSITATIIMAFAMALPSFILSITKEGEIKDRIESISRSIKSQGGDVTDLLKDTNEKLSALQTSPRKPVSLIFDSVISQKTSRVSITRLSYVAEGQDEAKITIFGTAENRESLINFERLLRANENFSDVLFPVANLAKQSDIDFTINLDVNK